MDFANAQPPLLFLKLRLAALYTAKRLPDRPGLPVCGLPRLWRQTVPAEKARPAPTLKGGAGRAFLS
ncbi:hypothetical protein ANACOL_01737 [Anaerotruncus colihominis DSM 17241]|uniref:Uncharacterized protein n=1 Tax=Anaerotruncus colihominis DSM 17241 TaxID=445972 RepID=B0PAD9_9FIRM|nr:hypothetical protein ANACOL_01737 [Anaerotruncus colihominis DSM 17241]